MTAYSLATLASFNPKTGSSAPVGGVFDNEGNFYGTTVTNSDRGVVFEVAKGSKAITVLAQFNGANGEDPNHGVVFDRSGNLYGTTYYGGPQDGGTVFEVAKGSNTVTTLTSFPLNNGQSVQPDGLVVDGQGNLFGMTRAGGPRGTRTLYEVAHGSNTIQTLATFTGYPTDPNLQSPDLVLNPQGDLFGIAWGSGASGLGSIFELTHGSTTVTTLASFNGINGSNPTELLTDGAGNLYGSTQLGGSSNHGTLFKVAAGSSTITTLVSFDGSHDGAEPTGVTWNPIGGLYGVTLGGGANGGGTLFSFLPGANQPWISTLYDFQPSDIHPSKIAVDTSLNMVGTVETGGAFGGGSVVELSPVAATPTFTGLSSPGPVTYGTPSVTVSGKIAAGSLVAEGNVTATVAGQSPVSAPILGDGSFTIALPTSSLAASAQPYPIQLSYAGDPSFNPAQDSSTALTVTKAHLTVTAGNTTRQFGAANPALTAILSGFVNGQSQATSGVTGAPTLATTANATSPAGSYPITSAVGTLASNNYDFSAQPGTLTVTHAPAPTNLQLVESSLATTDPAGTVVGTLSATGSYPGDALSFALLDSAQNRFVTDGARIKLNAGATLTPGTYTIRAQATDPEGQAVTQTFAITATAAPSTTTPPPPPAPLATPVFSGLAAASTVPFGTPSVVLRGTLRAGSGTPSGTVTATVAGVTSAPAPLGADGSFAITLPTAGLHASTTPSLIRYDFAGSGEFTDAHDASTTLTITKAPLVVAARDVALSYGVTNPALSYNITGFVGGQTQANAGITGAPSLTTTATLGSPVGAYAITASLGTLAAADYTFSFQSATLRVQPAPAPTNLQVATQSVSVMDPAGTIAGTVHADGNSPSDSLIYTLTNSDGGRFALVGNQIVVANGLTANGLPTMPAGPQVITVQATNSTGQTTSANLTLTITPVTHPTLVIVTHGQDPGGIIGGRGRGLGQGSDDWETPLAKNVIDQLRAPQTQPSLVHGVLIDWDTAGRVYGPAQESANDIEKLIIQTSASVLGPWDIFIVGHSRGGIFNDQLLRDLNLNSNPGIGKVEDVLLDATASRIDGDSYPASTPVSAPNPANFREQVYADNYHLTSGALMGGAGLVLGPIGAAGAYYATDSDRPISGAQYTNLQNDLIHWYASKPPTLSPNKVAAEFRADPILPHGLVHAFYDRIVPDQTSLLQQNVAELVSMQYPGSGAASLAAIAHSNANNLEVWQPAYDSTSDHIIDAVAGKLNKAVDKSTSAANRGIDHANHKINQLLDHNHNPLTRDLSKGLVNGSGHLLRGSVSAGGTIAHGYINSTKELAHGLASSKRQLLTGHYGGAFKTLGKSAGGAGKTLVVSHIQAVKTLGKSTGKAAQAVYAGTAGARKSVAKGATHAAKAIKHLFHH